MWILVILGIIMVIVIVYVLKEKIRKGSLTCKKCGKIYDYDDIEYRVVRSYNKNNDTGSYEVLKTYDRVEFVCLCENCGEVKRFTKDFLVYYYSYNKAQGRVGRNETYNIMDRIESYLNLDFKDKAEAKQLKKDIKEETKQIKKAIDQLSTMEKEAIINAIKMEETKFLSSMNPNNDN